MTPRARTDSQALLWRHKGLLALTLTQFLGALNDNAFKLIITLFVFDIVVNTDLASRYVSLASLIFVIPFILFSTHAGYISDRFSKRSVAIFAKFLEIGVMTLGLWALYLKSIELLLVLLFLMALQSTIFSPAKYGILPEILEERDLSNGNGIINLSTFLAIILGTVLGGNLLSLTRPDVYRAGVVFVLIALLGTLTSLFITQVPAASSHAVVGWNPLRMFLRNMREVKKDRVLFLCIVGIGYFWMLGAILLIILPLYGKVLLQADERMISWIMAALSLGIGVGSVVAGKVSGEKVELGLIPLGSIGLGLFSLDLAFAYHNLWHTLVDLFLAGAFAGCFIIPLNALLQARSPKESKGKMIATANVIGFLGVAFASGIVLLLTDERGLGLDISHTLAIVALATFAVTAYLLWLLPAAFLRFLLWVITHTIYRINVMGRERFPLEGPALLVCNHLSYVDPFLVAASVSRPIRFFMLRRIYEWKSLHWFFKLMQMIPISAGDPPRKLKASMEEAREALRQGEVVCIFAEGTITRVAQTLGFRRGVENIVKGLDIPLVPVHLDRVWGSIFSFRGGKFVWKFPRRIPYPVTVSFGHALPATSKVHEIRQAVLELGSEAFLHRQEELRPLHQMFLRQAKKQWLSKGMADSSGLSLRYGQIAVAAVSLARQLMKCLPNEERVGVLFPPSVAGALANIALPLAGKVPVNVNFTMSTELVDQVLAKAGIRKVVTSAKVLDALKWQRDERMVLMEDLKKPSLVLGALAWVLLRIIPVGFTESLFLRRARVSRSHLATLMFTSGSTGTPKGVMLTHTNIQSNVQGLLEIFQLDSNDTLIGVLPFFHSLGYTGTVWLPLLGGIRVVYHRSPLEPGAIEKLIRKHRGTIILGTPTFLQLWSKKFRRENVSSLRFAMVGAERLRDQVATEFLEKFGINVLEGYGCTELSPVACASVLNAKDRYTFQLGHKEGKVGRPLPGVSLRIIDPETKEVLPPGHSGLLLIKGPNVMQGYWEETEKTAEVIRDGWYVTGDIASIDNDGFIQITDRLSRFSKIGGEMVPHILLEEHLYESAGEPDARFLVTAVRDDKKGEALVVLHYNYSGDTDSLIGKLRQSGIPKLWIPDRRHFFKLDEWPVLGTGKVNLAKAKALAQELVGQNFKRPG